MSLAEQALALEAELEPVRKQGWFSANPRFDELGDLLVRAAFECNPVNRDLLERAERAYTQSYNHTKLQKLNELVQKLSFSQQ